MARHPHPPGPGVQVGAGAKLFAWSVTPVVVIVGGSMYLAQKVVRWLSR